MLVTTIRHGVVLPKTEFFVNLLIQGSQRKPGDLNFICPGPEIAWNLIQKWENLDKNKKFSRKPGILRYAKVQYYIETTF